MLTRRAGLGQNAGIVRDKHLNLQMSEEELKLIRGASEASDMKMATWARITLLRAAREGK